MEHECIELRFPKFGEIWSFDHRTARIHHILGAGANNPDGRYIVSQPYRLPAVYNPREWVNLYRLDTTQFIDQEEYAIPLTTFLNCFQFEIQDEV